MKKNAKSDFEMLQITSQDGSVRAEIVPELGAIVSSLEFNGRETLFQHDFFWDSGAEKTRGGIPFLFPICGRLERGGAANAWLCDRRIYSMPIHGFAMRMPWARAGAPAGHEVALELRDTEHTRAQYPFSFMLTLRMTAMPGAFLIRAECTNTGSRPMPYYAGFHPYFLTPEPGKGKELTRLDYKPVSRIPYNASLTDITGETPPPRFPASIADPQINEMLSRIGQDKQARLLMPDKTEIRLETFGIGDPDLFPYIQLYTLPDRPFFCVEPWMGFPNSLNSFDGCRRLAPGQTEIGVFGIMAIK